MALGTAYFTRTLSIAELPFSIFPSNSSPPNHQARPNTAPLFCYTRRSQSAGSSQTKQAQRYSVMPPELPQGSQPWLSGIRSCLRLLSVVLSGAVAGTLIHTLEIYRGNISLDLRSGELPMTWPARTNLIPTLILFAIAAANFLASVAIMAMSFKRSFRRPIRSRDVYRIVAGGFGVILWATALVVFDLLDKASKASLGRYACSNRNVMSNGRYQYRAVCSEQGVAFYLAIGAASAEAVTLLTLAITALQAARKPTTLNFDEKKAAMTGRYP